MLIEKILLLQHISVTEPLAIPSYIQQNILLAKKKLIEGCAKKRYIGRVCIKNNNKFSLFCFLKKRGAVHGIILFHGFDNAIPGKWKG
jgi:hypothetical protein